MKCNEFWKKACSHLEDHDLIHLETSEPLKEHLRECQKCTNEWHALSHGLSQLRDDVQSEMDQYFWEDMRRNVRRQVKGQNREKWYQSLFPWPFAWASALAASLVALFLIFHGQSHNGTRFPATYDLVAMFDQSDLFEMDLPVDRTEAGSVLEDIDDEEELTDPYLLTGVSDSWSGVLDEANQDDQVMKKKGRAREDKIGGVLLIAPKRA